MDTKEQAIEVEGVVTVVRPGTMFRVELPNKHLVLATICGKMRKRWVRISTGDRGAMKERERGRATQASLLKSTVISSARDDRY